MYLLNLRHIKFFSSLVVASEGYDVHIVAAHVAADAENAFPVFMPHDDRELAAAFAHSVSLPKQTTEDRTLCICRRLPAIQESLDFYGMSL